MTELINRPEYLKQLIENKDVNLVKIITGIRRCGKSSLLDLFHQYLTQNGVSDENIIHMNLESLRYRNLSNYLSFYDYVSELIPKNGKTYLIFDELQVIEHWEKAIESFLLILMLTFTLLVLMHICYLQSFQRSFLEDILKFVCYHYLSRSFWTFIILILLLQQKKNFKNIYNLEECQF